jgi:hypothetical protein
VSSRKIVPFISYELFDIISHSYQMPRDAWRLATGSLTFSVEQADIKGYAGLPMIG